MSGLVSYVWCLDAAFLSLIQISSSPPFLCFNVRHYGFVFDCPIMWPTIPYIASSLNSRFRYLTFTYLRFYTSPVPFSSSVSLLDRSSLSAYGCIRLQTSQLEDVNSLLKHIGKSSTSDYRSLCACINSKDIKISVIDIFQK